MDLNFPRPMLNSPVKNDIVGFQFLEKVLGRLARTRESFHSVETMPITPASRTGRFKDFLENWFGRPQ